MARQKAKIDTVLPLLPGLAEFIKAEARAQSLLFRALDGVRRVKDGVKRAVRARRRREKRGLSWESSPLAKAERWIKEKEIRWEILYEAAKYGAGEFVKRRPYHYGWEEVVEEILRELVRRMENRRLGITRGKKRIPEEKRWKWTEVPLRDLRRRAFSDARYIAKEPKVITNLTYRPYFRAQDPEEGKKVPQNADLIPFSVLTKDQDGEYRELSLPESGTLGISPEDFLLAVEQATGSLALAWA